MFVMNNMSVNEKGNLTIGEFDTLDLVRDYGTPLYVMDEQVIRDNCKRFKNSVDNFYGGNGLVCYASKALCCKEMCRIMLDEGLGLDVVSGGELYTAISTGFPTDKICFHGNNKTDDELNLAIRYGVGRIVVDNIDELLRLNKLVKMPQKKVGVFFRIKPGIDAHTHDFIRTGQIDSKFGFALENGEAYNAVKLALECENVYIRGIHCHIGSQIFEIAPFEHAAEVMINFIAKVKNELGYEIPELNLGGGFGIKYTTADNPPDYETYMQRVAEVIERETQRLEINKPFILIEPGRSIVGPAGITLYKVGNTKEIEGVRNYIAVDGGMTDNIRYALYKARYDMLIANKANEPKNYKATIAGKCCESGDLLGEDILIQKPDNEDVLAVLATGAYNYSMASNYNRIARPAIVMVNKDRSKVIVKRETQEDLIRHDV